MIEKVRGFTLVEVMMAMGISVFVLLTAVAVLSQFLRKTNETHTATEMRLDLAALERSLFEDLGGAFPTLGNLKTADSINGGVGFFDYFNGLPPVKIPASMRTRTLRLDASGSGPSSVEFISENKRLGNRKYFQPAQAYRATLSISSPGVLTYIGVNAAAFFTNFYPAHWSAQGHFLFYAPAALQQLRALTSGLRPVRFYSILVRASGGDVATDTLDGSFDTTHPVIAGQDVADVDKFLRLLPSLGGAMAEAVVEPVLVVRYKLVPAPGKGYGKVFRAVKEGPNYAEDVFLSDGVESLEFQRPDVTSRQIDFKVNLWSGK